MRGGLLRLGDDERVDVVVENRVETSDPTRRPPIERPRVVDDLLAIPGAPSLGTSRLLSSPEAIPAIGVPLLVDKVLRSSGRRLPAIVCTQPNHDDEDAWLTRARLIAERARGIATVFTLDRAAARVGLEVPQCALPDAGSIAEALEDAAAAPGAERAIRFGAEQLLLQHRALFDLLEARCEAREDY